jgi:integrase
MALYKRGTTYHTDFSVNGQRFRQSLDTSDWREAQAKEKELIAQASQNKLTPPSHHRLSRLSFDHAAERYRTTRKLELAPASFAKEGFLLKKLREYFQNRPLNRIALDDILAYREWRSQEGVGPATINMEIGALRRVLKRAKLWYPLADEIKPLKEPSTIGRALILEEKLRLLKVASNRPEWQTAYWAAILALNTTMRGCELKGLRWSDVDLFERTLTIRKSKTTAGERILPLTEDAYQVLLSLHRRATQFGPVEQSHFVFGSFRTKFRFHGTTVVDAGLHGFNPKFPLGSWRSAWRTLTKKAGLPGLRFHDLRHQAITELAESGASDSTIMSIAGHVSRRMLERYSHVRLEAKRKALDVLSGRRGVDIGYVTIHDTNQRTEGNPETQVKDKIGGPGRVRTDDLFHAMEARSQLRHRPTH